MPKIYFIIKVSLRFKLKSFYIFEMPNYIKYKKYFINILICI